MNIMLELVPTTYVLPMGTHYQNRFLTKTKMHLTLFVKFVF